MSTAQEFVNTLPFIIFFLILALIIGTVFGEKALYWFLVLILASMLLLNSNKIAAIGNLFKKEV